MGKSKTSIVKETNLGVYVALSAGIPIDDGEGHVLAIPAREGDRRRVRTLLDMARVLGYGQLTYQFLAGVRPVSDDEYAVQQSRLEAGLIPDPNELGTALDDLKEARLRK